MEKFNYLALMMVDKNVHFHVIPRYSTKINHNNKIFVDSGWLKLPNSNYSNEIYDIDMFKLKEIIESSFK